MGKLIFRYTEEDFIEDNREANEIELSVPDDMNITEYKVMCVRMAYAMGYNPDSIKRGFGDIIYGDEDVNTLKNLLDELSITRNN